MLANRVRMGTVQDSGLVVYDYGNTKFDTVTGVAYSSAGYAPILQNDYIYFNHDGWTNDFAAPVIAFNVKVQDFTKITIEYRHEESRTVSMGGEYGVPLFIVFKNEFSDAYDWSGATRIKLDEALSKTTATMDIPNNNQDKYLGLSTEVSNGSYGGYANIYKIILHN